MATASSVKFTPVNAGVAPACAGATGATAAIVGDAAALVVVRIAAGLWPPDSAAGAVSVVSSVSVVELDAVVGAVEDVVLAASEDAPLEEPDDAPDDALEEPDDAPLDESCELAELSRIDASTDELAAEVDFSRYSVLFASGRATNGIQQIFKTYEAQHEGRNLLTVELFLNDTEEAPLWNVALLVPALPEGAQVDLQVLHAGELARLLEEAVDDTLQLRVRHLRHDHVLDGRGAEALAERRRVDRERERAGN